MLAAILAGGDRSDADLLAGSLAVGQAHGKYGGAVGCEVGRPDLKMGCVRRKRGMSSPHVARRLRWRMETSMGHGNKESGGCGAWALIRL